MIAVYQLFKIIFGIIVSVFVLTMLLFVATGYSGVQEGVLKGTITTVFRDYSERIYYSGDFGNFSEFDRRDFQLRFDGTDPPGIRYLSTSSSPKIDFRVPTYFAPGQILMISGHDMDMGWWRYKFIEVHPEMVIVFNPKQQEKDFIISITEMFLDTEYLDPDIKFALCDGSGYEDDPLPVNDFIRHINGIGQMPTGACTLPIHDYQRLVIIDQNCGPNANINSICIKPASGEVGQAFVRNAGPLYYMKDYTFALAAIILGGAGYDPLNNVEIVGEKVYDYAMEEFLQEMYLASSLNQEKSIILANAIDPMEYADNSDIITCRIHFASFATGLGDVKSVVESMLEDLERGRELEESDLRDFVTASKSARNILLNDLLDLGCDFRVQV